MKKIDHWPPPNWTEVVILWRDILDKPLYPIKDILAWVENQPGGQYHLHGWRATEGFAFRFERPEDATAFALKWT